MVEPRLERTHDRRAARGLRRVHARQVAVDEANLAELAEAADDAREQRAASDRRHDVPRIAPAELLDDLEAVRFRSLRVIRPQVDVDEPPSIAIGDLRAQPIHVVVIAGDRQDRRSEDCRPKQLPRFEVIGNEDTAFDAEPGRVRRYAVGEVPGRSAGENLESQFHRPCRRHRDDAIFIGQRRMIHRIVFDVELVNPEPPRQPIAAHERGKS